MSKQGRSSVVEQRPFKPFRAFCPQLPRVAKARHFNEMWQIRLAMGCRNSPEIDNPSATRSDTGKSPSDFPVRDNAGSVGNAPTCQAAALRHDTGIVGSNQASAINCSFL
jgi:hypothetical protein